MSRTLEQKIADAEARLQRLKAKVRKPGETQLRAWLLHLLKTEVTRQADVSRIQPLIDELNALPKPVPKEVSENDQQA
ncbi:mobilization protein [Escherichia coli]|nr:mobilization protein [Escherichia coli]